MNYIIVTESGKHCLVSASSAADANTEWGNDIDAEPHIPGLTRRASKADIREAVANGHDYR